jgi:hypothetical protein
MWSQWAAENIEKGDVLRFRHATCFVVDHRQGMLSAGDTTPFNVICRVIGACQREPAHDRALRRAFKLRGMLGAEGGIGDYVAKPKWMRWRTYDRAGDRGATKEGDRVMGLFHLAVIIIALALLPAALSVVMALGALAMCALIVIAVVAIGWWLLVAYPTLWVLILRRCHPCRSAIA